MMLFTYYLVDLIVHLIEDVLTNHVLFLIVLVQSKLFSLVRYRLLSHIRQLLDSLQISICFHNIRFGELLKIRIFYFLNLDNLI